VRLGHPQVGFRGGDLGAHAVQLQAHVLRVEARQRLVLAHPIAGLHQPLDDLAADTERQLRLVARVHFAGIAFARLAGRLRMHDHDRPRQLLRRLAVTTGGQSER